MKKLRTQIHRESNRGKDGYLKMKECIYLNKKVKQFVAGMTMMAVGTVAMPFWANAADMNTQADNGAYTAVAEKYYPVRDMMTKFGVEVGWEKVQTEKITFAMNGQKYEVVVNRDTQQVETPVGGFQYSTVDNRIQLPTKFFETVLSNVSFTEKNGVLKSQLLDATQAMSLKNLNTYVQESQPVAQPQAQTATYYESGIATWYGAGLHGNYTASGEVFNMYDYTAAHKYLPFGTRVRVTNQNNGKSVIVRITDRGPFAPGRVIDLSMQAASDINMVSSGIAPVSLEILN